MATQRRLFALAAIAVMNGIVAFAACSFPDPQLVPDEGGTTTDGPGTDVADDRPGTDAGADVDPFADVVEPDAPPPIDATSEKPLIDAAGCFCDCDKDGYRRMDQDASGCDASTTLFDCDDLDPRAHPNAGFVRDQPTNDTLGDWNCSGFVTREVPAVKTTCAGRNILTSCNGVEGFLGDPGCGEKQSYVYCEVQTASCENGKLEERVQGCK